MPIVGATDKVRMLRGRLVPGGPRYPGYGELEIQAHLRRYSVGDHDELAVTQAEFHGLILRCHQPKSPSSARPVKLIT